MHRVKSTLVAGVLAIGTLFVCGAMACADPMLYTVHITDYPVPTKLDLQGPAVTPESDLQPCPSASRKQLQPVLDAITSLVDRAGGTRLWKPGTAPGDMLKTPDGLRLTLTPTPANGSYVIAIDSTHQPGRPMLYLAPCLRMAAGDSQEMEHLNLPLQQMSLGTAQYSPAIGFYIFMQH